MQRINLLVSFGDGVPSSSCLLLTSRSCLGLLERMSSEIFIRVIVAAEDIEVVAIDLDVGTDSEVARSDELHVVIDVLILLSAQERSLNDTRVLLSGLEDRDSVISQVERDDEPPVNILGHLRVEARSISQDLLVIVDVLEEINLRLLWHEIVDIAERVHLVTEAIVRRNLHNDSSPVGGLLDVSEGEVTVILLQIVVLRCFIDTADSEHSAVSGQRVAEFDLVASEVSVTNERLTGLVDIEGLGQLLSPEVDRERISAVVGEVHLSDLNRVVSKEVMPDELKVFTSREESENLAVKVEELLLRGDSTTAELLLKVLEQLRVLLGRHRLERLGEAILGASLRISLRSTNILQKEIMRYIK